MVQTPSFPFGGASAKTDLDDVALRNEQASKSLWLVRVAGGRACQKGWFQVVAQQQRNIRMPASKRSSSTGVAWCSKAVVAKPSVQQVWWCSEGWRLPCTQRFDRASNVRPIAFVPFHSASFPSHGVVQL